MSNRCVYREKLCIAYDREYSDYVYVNNNLLKSDGIRINCMFLYDGLSYFDIQEDLCRHVRRWVCHSGAVIVLLKETELQKFLGQAQLDLVHDRNIIFIYLLIDNKRKITKHVVKYDGLHEVKLDQSEMDRGIISVLNSSIKTIINEMNQQDM